MDLAVRTTASTTEIWVIVIAMSILTAILVSAPAIADSWQVRANRRARRLAALGFDGIGAADAGRAAAATGVGPHGETGVGPHRETVPGQRPGAPPTEAPTVPDLPAVPGPPTVPEQRGSESDSAARTQRGGGPPDNPGRADCDQV
jgi:hypothetical protein